MLLADKSIVVTGGNSGIGKAIVLAAAAEGANVVVDYRMHPEYTAEVLAAAGRAGGRAIGVEADVSRTEACTGSSGPWRIRPARRPGQQRGYRNPHVAAGDQRSRLRQGASGQPQERFFGAQFAAQQFMAQGSGGLVVTISSTHEDWAMSGNIAYCVSKGGAKMLTRRGRRTGVAGIRFVNVAPGAVSTPINAVTEMDPELLRRLNAAIPLGRIRKAAEIANVVMFLASDKAGYLNATTVTVDGGLSQSSVGL